MLECLVVSKGTIIILTLLLVLSEALGETKAVKSNGILHFFVELVEHSLRALRRILFK